MSENKQPVAKEIVTLPAGLWGTIKATIKAVPIAAYGSAKAGELQDFMNAMDAAQVQRVTEEVESD